MARKTTSQSDRRKRQWFAPRQVYLRTGQDSQYVELSPLLQAGLAIGLGVVALWLLGATYGAALSYLDRERMAALGDALNSAEQRLSAATGEAARVPELEAALADARAATADAQQIDETMALRAELDQTRAQLENLRVRLSEAKAEEAALQARVEAQAVAGSDYDQQAVEEASSLHGQLEDAYREIEQLQQGRDEAEASLAALMTENAAKDENAARHAELLRAATTEIERLQEEAVNADREHQDGEARYQAEIAELEKALDQETATGEELRVRLDRITTELQQAQQSPAPSRGIDIAADAEGQAQAIAADLREADLLATIDGLRAEIAAERPTDDIVDHGNDAEVDDLKQRLAIAEAEIERMVRNGLSVDDGSEEAAAVETGRSGEAGQGESNRLKSELATAKADIIKLKADVKAARQRLASQPEEADSASRPDNTAKLEQQLASTRSRVQQLNKALADAKLREVAVDLALINVVPSPSPPAPR